LSLFDLNPAKEIYNLPDKFKNLAKEKLKIFAYTWMTSIRPLFNLP